MNRRKKQIQAMNRMMMRKSEFYIRRLYRELGKALKLRDWDRVIYIVHILTSYTETGKDEKR